MPVHKKLTKSHPAHAATEKAEKREHVVHDVKPKAQEPAVTPEQPIIPEVIPAAIPAMVEQTPSVVEPSLVDTNPGMTAMPQIKPITSDSQPLVTEIEDTEEPHEHDHSTSRWVLIIVVLILLIIAVLGLGFYYLTQYGPGVQSDQPLVSPQPVTMVSPTQAPESGDDQTVMLKKTQSGDDVSSIEADVNNTKLDGLNKEVTDIDSELSGTASSGTR